MNKPEDIIAKAGFYAAAIHGVSMYPMLINHIDTVYIVPVDIPKKHDVILYRRKGNNQLVLHRLIKVENDGYLMCGDNEFIKERITQKQIIGVMKEFTHYGKHHTPKNLVYKLYVFLWTAPDPLKKTAISLYGFYRNIRHLFYRALGKLRRTLRGKKK